MGISLEAHAPLVSALYAEMNSELTHLLSCPHVAPWTPTLKIFYPHEEPVCQ